jgi:YVTN family beta-propeller protein
MGRFLLASLAAALTCGCRARTPAPAPAPPADTEAVGRRGENRTVLPVNQVVTPLGIQVDLPGLRPQALALSPDGRILIAAGKTAEVVVVDPATGAIRQRVPLPRTKDPRAASGNVLRPDKEGQLSFTGLQFSPDGRRAFLSDVNGSVVDLAVGEGLTLRVARSIRLPDARAPRRTEEIPAGLAVSADGRKLYVCGNLSNRVFEIDVASGRVRRTFDVGVAPYDVVLAGGKAYVSNWGGRRPRPGELTGPAGRGTTVKVDPVKHVASEGSVTVIDLATGRPRAEILTGLHASALAVSPHGRYVVCANAASDTLSVIDALTDAVVETIWAKPTPADLFGAQPNALAFDPSGRTLYVANGTQNAVGLVAFDPGDGGSRLRGLLPVGWFPGALVHDAPRGVLHVANIKGHPKAPKVHEQGEEAPPGATGFNSHHYSGSLSLVPLPAHGDLPALSEAVARNLRRERIAEALLPPRPGQPARAVPERIGEPSLIRHVVYVIKENRTYDQVLGDVPAGNGEPSLCIFGERVTPNQHKLVREFVLLDNTYCAGILSADGHQWSTTAIGTDYLERSFAGWPRSYPDGMGEDEADALAYSPAGFIWDSALRKGVTIRNYGEFMAPAVRWREPRREGAPDFLANYRTWKGESQESVFASYPVIETIRPFSPTAYVGWEMAVPDQYRADFILEEVAGFVARGAFPQLTIVCLPNDHTSGTKEGWPTPAAQVADNDLAFGRIVEALSRSPFWREMAILAIEDDPQNGWDHVSGYRTTAYLASPYAKRGRVVSTQYNTTSLLRTIEQILGLPPMNQFDASAVPMRDAFTDTPDFRPFVAVPANVPLDQMNPDARALADPVARRDALASARMNFRQVDKAPEDALNRILWRAAKGAAAPYPEWAVTLVADGDDE